MSLTISEDTARAALEAARYTHCPSAYECIEGDPGNECPALCHAHIEECGCRQAIAWRELARLLGER